MKTLRSHRPYSQDMYSRYGVIMLLIALFLGLSFALVPAPAFATASVSVTSDAGNSQASSEGPTTLSIRGNGFQSIEGAFGGIYVFFGWVSDASGGTWAPSQGGITGTNYRYVPDSEAKDNQGYQRFVAFPGSETASSANGGLIEADGTWQTQLVVPGSSFQAVDRAGATVTVDCLQVQCGVITVGAHGVVNSNNETFTPISFDAGTTNSELNVQETIEDASAAEQPTASESSKQANTATVSIDQNTAIAGHSLSFIAQGFTPGEQVIGILDDGVVAVGPLTAGNQGEIAAVIQLPTNLRVGTHVLQLTGATSKQNPQVEVTVRKDSAVVAAEEAALLQDSTNDKWWNFSTPEIFVIVAGILLLIVIVVSAITATQRRKPSTDTTLKQSENTLNSKTGKEIIDKDSKTPTTFTRKRDLDRDNDLEETVVFRPSLKNRSNNDHKANPNSIEPEKEKSSTKEISTAQTFGGGSLE